MNDFDKLLSELGTIQTDLEQTMVKALPADDGTDEKNIQAAAAEGGQDGDGDDDGNKPDGDADDKGQMVKSFEVTLETGEKAQAFDGTEMLKAMQADFESRLGKSDANVAAALTQVTGVLKSQNELIKSLQQQVSALGNEGRGRKAVVSIAEKPATLAKSQAADGVSPEVFFAKALTAQKEGRISGTDVALAETMLNRGQAIPEALIQRVMGQ